MSPMSMRIHPPPRPVTVAARHPDDVEVLPDRDQLAGDGEDGDPEQVEDEEEHRVAAYRPTGISATVS